MVAFVAAALVAAVTLLAAPAQAAPCDTTTSVQLDCQTDTTTITTVTTVTTEQGASTTTARPPTTTATTARQTATTVRQTSTTARATTTSLETISTVSNLLVPGDGTQGAESTTTTVATATTVSDGGLSDGTLIMLVIAGLLLIALVVSLLTWRYWVATRPPLLEDSPRTGQERGGRATRTTAPVR
jgi:hypothetical protein